MTDYGQLSDDILDEFRERFEARIYNINQEISAMQDRRDIQEKALGHVLEEQRRRKEGGK